MSKRDLFISDLMALMAKHGVTLDASECGLFDDSCGTTYDFAMVDDDYCYSVTMGDILEAQANAAHKEPSDEG